METLLRFQAPKLRASKAAAGSTALARAKRSNKIRSFHFELQTKKLFLPDHFEAMQQSMVCGAYTWLTMPVLVATSAVFDTLFFLSAQFHVMQRADVNMIPELLVKIVRYLSECSVVTCLSYSHCIPDLFLRE